MLNNLLYKSLLLILLIHSWMVPFHKQPLCPGPKLQAGTRSRSAATGTHSATTSAATSQPMFISLSGLVPISWNFWGTSTNSARPKFTTRPVLISGSRNPQCPVLARFGKHGAAWTLSLDVSGQPTRRMAGRQNRIHSEQGLLGFSCVRWGDSRPSQEGLLMTRRKEREVVVSKRSCDSTNKCWSLHFLTNKCIDRDGFHIILFS